MAETLRGIFHIHSHYSYDCLLKTRAILETAKSKDYDFIVITDHDTINGSVDAKKHAEEFGLEVVIGAEYYSDHGDIIGIFLNDEINSRKFHEIVSDIRAQKGIVILPHPYKKPSWDSELIREIEMIEVFNARMSREDNNKAMELARQYNKKIIVGSDAHLKKELLLTEIVFKKNSRYTSLKEYFINETPEFKFEYSNNENILRSQMIKAVNRRNLRLLVITCIKFLLCQAGYKRDINP